MNEDRPQSATLTRAQSPGVVSDREEPCSESIIDPDEAAHLAHVGTLWQALVHDVRNQINIVKTAGYYLNWKLTPTDSRVARHLELIDAACTNAAQLLSELSDYASQAHSTRTPLKVSALVSRAVLTCGVERSRFEISLDESMEVRADEAMLVTALRKLFQNAGTRATNPGPIIISAETLPSGVRLCIRDPGPPVPDRQCSTMFNPPGSSAQPTHLDLAIVGQTILALRGTGRCSATAEGGCEIQLDLPV